jgi:hypothetical protein
VLQLTWWPFFRNCTLTRRRRLIFSTNQRARSNTRMSRTNNFQPISELVPTCACAEQITLQPIREFVTQRDCAEQISTNHIFRSHTHAQKKKFNQS